MNMDNLGFSQEQCDFLMANREKLIINPTVGSGMAYTLKSLLMKEVKDKKDKEIKIQAIKKEQEKLAEGLVLENSYNREKL